MTIRVYYKRERRVRARGRVTRIDRMVTQEKIIAVQRIARFIELSLFF